MDNYKLVKFKNQSLELDVEVDPNEDTVWLSKEQMALLFDRDRTVISRHINKIYDEGELDKKSTCAKNAHVPLTRNRLYETDLYNLDVIISVGYRVKSKNGVTFRKWATSVLKEYLLKGYCLDKNRTLITNENYINLVNEVNNLKNDVIDIKKLLSSRFSNSFICSEGNVYDGFAFVNNLICSAKKRVIIIDGYADSSILDFFVGCKKNVRKIVICQRIDRIDNAILNKFIKQYGDLVLKEDKSYHDRFLIIDDDIYLLGTSLNSLGNKTSTITKTNQYKIEEIYRDE